MVNISDISDISAISDMNYIGFWKVKRESYENIMPWETDWPNIPIENSANGNQDDIIKLLLLKQEFIDAGNGGQMKHYFGISMCRICNKPNGCSEYSIDGFVWPSGYIHYLQNHNVMCEPIFKNYLISSNK
jgi:hypothetical protein